MKCSEQRGQSKFLPSRGYNHHSHKTGFTFLDVIDILWQWQVNKYICWKTWWIFILLTALNCHLVTGPIHVSELVAAQACRPPTSPTWWPTDILRKVSIENGSIEKLQSDDEAFLDRLTNIMVQGVHWGLVIGYIPNILQDYRQDESGIHRCPKAVGAVKSVKLVNFNERVCEEIFRQKNEKHISKLMIKITNLSCCTQRFISQTLKWYVT